MTDERAIAEQAIEQAEHAAEDAAILVATELMLEHVRPVRKHEAILRIVAAYVHPLTGKPHSYSSAETLVETDPMYAEHLAELRRIGRDRALAQSKVWAARVRAELAVRCLGTEVGA